jgi:hypothetical protein
MIDYRKSEIQDERCCNLWVSHGTSEEQKTTWWRGIKKHQRQEKWMQEHKQIEGTWNEAVKI